MDIFIFCIIVASLFIFILILISAFLLKIYSGKSLGDPKYPQTKGTVFCYAFHFKRLYDYQTELAKKHPTFRLLAPQQCEYYTTDPRNIEYVLKTNFAKYDKGRYQRDTLGDLFGQGIFIADGDKWKQQRKLASFEFSTRVLRDFSCAIFRERAVKLVEIIAELSMAGQIIDIHDLFMRYALDSIFEVGFGVDLSCLEGSSKEGADFMKAFDDADALVFRRFVDPVWKIKRFLKIGSEAALKRNLKVMHDFVSGVIKQKRKLLAEQHCSSIEKKDILSRFLAVNNEYPEQVNDEYLRDIILNFMIAGKDTTANALSWFIFVLCKNPLVQEKIVQEVRLVCGVLATDANKFVELTTDDKLEKMHYLHAALSETLRLYPPVPQDGRSAMADDILPDGNKVKKGDNVHYLAYAMGRMHWIWGEDAEDFRPERWLQNGTFQPESPFKFIAFHAGPRICLGRDFAYRQMKIVSCMLLYFFRFQLADEKRKVTYRIMLTLHIDGGLHVKAIPRISSEPAEPVPRYLS